MDLANAYAAEHLCLLVADPWSLVGRVRNAGGVFVGEHSFEVLGDYVAGPSHVMPTEGSARYASPLSVADFVKRINLVALTQAAGARLSAPAAVLARGEGLTAHAAAAEMRRDAGAAAECGRGSMSTLGDRAADPAARPRDGSRTRPSCRSRC